MGDPTVAKKTKYRTISLPMGISDEIDALIEELKYWPSRGAFVREACLVKIRDERKLLKELREAENPDSARNRGKRIIYAIADDDDKDYGFGCPRSAGRTKH